MSIILTITIHVLGLTKHSKLFTDSNQNLHVSSLLTIIPLVSGLAHITGGGFIYNIPRILPDHLSAQINLNSWEMPEIFCWLNTTVQISHTELLKLLIVVLNGNNCSTRK